MSSKVRIKAGPVEFEYEGETELSISDIKDLFSHIETLFSVSSAETGNGAAAEEGGNAGEGDAPLKGAQNQLHVNSIANKLNAKSGPDVALAAAASLQIVDGHDTFSRKQLLDRMKLATRFYKKSMANNLSSYINTLLDGKLNQTSGGQYSLTSPEHDRLVSALA